MPSHTVVIGAGRVGTRRRRAPGSAAYGRGAEVPLDGVRLVCIATPDGAIAEVCAALAPRLSAEHRRRPLLGRDRASTRSTSAPGPRACVHPVQTIWPERGPDQLEGAYGAVTGDWELGAGLARELGLEPFPLADEMKVALPRRDGLRRELPRDDHPDGGRPARADRARPRPGPARARPAPAPHGRRGGREPRPARSTAATPRRSRRISRRSAPSSRRSTGRSGGPPCRSSIPRRRPRCATSCDDRPRPHDGRPPRRPPRPPPPGAIGVRRRRHEPLREPDPVRAGRGSRHATRATRSATGRSPPRRASTASSRRRSRRCIRTDSRPGLGRRSREPLRGRAQPRPFRRRRHRRPQALQPPAARRRRTSARRTPSSSPSSGA